jgi:hypothetical protein
VSFRYRDAVAAYSKTVGVPIDAADFRRILDWARDKAREECNRLKTVRPLQEILTIQVRRRMMMMMIGGGG